MQTSFVNFIIKTVTVNIVLLFSNTNIVAKQTTAAPADYLDHILAQLS